MPLACLQYPALSNSPQAPESSQLLVMLHGWGSNAQDLAALAPVFHQPHLHLMFPDAPYSHPTIPGGRMWYHIETGEHLNSGRRALHEWLIALSHQINIPLEKTILGGFSQGGAMTLDVGLDLPLAGLICLSGYWHPDISENRQGHSKPILMLHGSQDEVIPLQVAQEARDELNQRRLPVEYHELDMAHEVTAEALGLIQRFLTRIQA